MEARKKPLKVNEAADALGLSVACLRAWIAKRRIAYLRLGRSIRVSQQEVDRLLSEGTVPARRGGR